MKVSKSLTDADIQTHADAHGIGDAEVVSKIKREFEQCSLPGFQFSYQDELSIPKDRASVDRVRAEALKNPQSPQHLAEAFKEGDVISSILPDYLKGAIPSFNIVGAVIETPEDFAKLTWTLRTPYMEVMKVAFLNRNGKAVHSATLSVGAINATYMNAQMVLRELQHIAGKTKTNRVILSHNHPSGDPTPSVDDMRCTEVLAKALKVAGIELVDHVVTNGKKYASWKKAWTVLPLETPQPSWEVVPRVELPKINSPDDLEKIVASLRQADPNHDHVIYGDSKLQISAVERLASSLSVEELALQIARGSGREGAMHVWFESVQRQTPEIRRLSAALQQIEIILIDAGIGTTRSLKSLGLLETTPEIQGRTGYHPSERISPMMDGDLRLREDVGSPVLDRVTGMQTEFLFDCSPAEAKDLERDVFARQPLSRIGKLTPTEKNYDFGRSQEGSDGRDATGHEPREDRANSQAVPDAGERLPGEHDRGRMAVPGDPDQVGPAARVATDPLDLEKGKRPRDTRLDTSKPVELTPQRRVAANLRAMEIVARRRKDQDFSPVSKSERETLRQYTGWGGLANEFLDPRKSENAERLQQIKELIGPEGQAAITAGVKNAHYTSYEVIQFGWNAAQKLGFKGGHVLEPAAGVGNLIGLAPKDLPTQFLAVELDPLPADIARLLYPDSQVIQSPFERVSGYKDRFDLVFTNVPFGDYKPKCTLADPYRGLKPLIHDYFILRQLDMVRPGGLCIVITGKGTLDKASGRIRDIIAGKADLVTAFRLPESTFEKNADTSVTTDLLILRKRLKNEWMRGESFARLDTDPASGLRINEYFVRHPENMFGRMVEGGMLGRQQGKLTGVEATDLPKYFAAALERLKPLDFLPEPFTGSKEIGIDLRPCPATLRIGELVYEDDRFYSVVAEGGMTEWFVPHEARSELCSALAIKEKLRALLSAQLEHATDEGLGVLQTELRELVGKHLERFCDVENLEDGRHFPLNTPTLREFMEADPDYFKITSLVDRGIRYSDIFSTRTIFSAAYQPQPPGPEASLEDIALFVRQQHGTLDVEKIAQLKGISVPETREGLLKEGVAFADPAGGNLVHRIEYLAGDDVYAKLDAARSKAATDPLTFQRNVEELEKIIPKKIPLEELSINSRQPIYDATLLQAFLRDRLQGDFTVRRFLTGRIEVEGWSEEDSAQGSANGSYSKAFAAYANRETLRIRGDRADDQEMTPEERQILQAKRQAQREFEQKTSKDFASWVKDNGDKVIAIGKREEPVRDYVERVYNRAFNRSVSPAYDGSRLRFHGIAGEMNGQPLYLHKHNLDFAARMLFEGRGGNAHCVGAGKTFAGSLTVKAWKQSGIVRKPAFIVPKKVLEKWAKEYTALFPGDHVMVIDRFDKANREEMLSRIAISSPDAIFMTHEHAKMIPNDPKIETALIEEELATLRQQLFEAEQEGAPKRTLRSIENSIAKFENRLTDLREYSKTNRITFLETGIDAVVIDEAHNYKNLPVQATEQAAGIPSGSSQRAFDLYMKTRQVLEAHQNRGVLLLTATPVSNTMAEIYNMVKFVAPEAWTSRGIRSFDNWIDMFGEIVTKPQVLVDGTFGIRSSLSSFKNLPELKQIFESFWEARTAEQLQLRRPIAEVVVRVVEPSPDQSRYFEEIVERAEAIREKKVEPEFDNMLKLTVDGRKAALDMRLVDPVTYGGFGEYPNSKLNVVADEIWSRYEEARGRGIEAGQLVFFDLYAVEALQEAEVAEERKLECAEPENGEEMEEPLSTEAAPSRVAEANGSLITLDLHNELARQLAQRGIPPEEIAILNGRRNASAAAKQMVSDRYNEGKLRVVIGTTPAMGEGMNLQRITTAIHHADVPLKPSHMEQRDGRGLRQGNIHKQMEILRYTTRGSFDQYLYQLLERKARFIGMFMSEQRVERTVEGAFDAVVLSYEEAMGATAKDPRIRDYFVNKVKLSQAEVTLKGAEQEWRSVKFHVREIAGAMQRCDERLARGERRLAERDSILRELLGQRFDPKTLPNSLPLRLKVNGRAVTDEKEMGAVLDGLLEKRMTGGKDDPRWVIAVKKEIPGGVLELSGAKFASRMVKGVEFSVYDEDFHALVRHDDVVPIPVTESRSAVSQLMGNVRYELRSMERSVELVKEERASLESSQRSGTRRLETAEKNLTAARKTCEELRGKVQALAGEIGVDGKGKIAATKDVVGTDMETDEVEAVLNSVRRRSPKHTKREKSVEMER